MSMGMMTLRKVTEAYHRERRQARRRVLARLRYAHMQWDLATTDADADRWAEKIIHEEENLAHVEKFGGGAAKRALLGSWSNG
jgi:hypothetical protein